MLPHMFLVIFLDVYVFGIGEKVKKHQLNALASKKRDETHVFVLKNYNLLGEVFNRIISKQEITFNHIIENLKCNSKQ